MTTTGTKTTKKWSTQTWTGKRFGPSAVVVGRILSTAGLKQGPEATSKTVLTGHARRFYTADQRPYWMWDMDAVGEVVEEALVHHGGPPIEKLVMRVREPMEWPMGNESEATTGMQTSLKRRLTPTSRPEWRGLYVVGSTVNSTRP